MNIQPGKTLEDWLKSAPKDTFPPVSRDYIKMYENMADHLYNNVHTDVNMGAFVKDGLLLTDHGPNHIRSVIKRASDLVRAEACELTSYEVYLLLSAIHFHDVGNIFGRKGHENKSREVIKDLGRLACFDDTEKRQIHQIADAHGGSDKEKLEKLPEIESILHTPVRVRLLAAILKFADELADDFSRASNIKWEQIPMESEIYHKYAQTLRSLTINHRDREIKIKFSLTKEDALNVFGKDKGKTTYLLDEIYERTLKSHLERTYCMRFMIPLIRLDSISVRIEFHDNIFDEIHEPIGYRLLEKGYPNHLSSFKEAVEQPINDTGETVRNFIQSREEEFANGQSTK